jgi:hypothetical protein
MGYGWFEGAMPVTVGRRATVDGVATTQYVFHENTQQLVGRLNASPGDAALAASIFKGATATITYTLDDAGLPHRVTSDVTTVAGRLLTTWTYRDWGRSVTVRVPTSSDVTTTLG